MRAEKFTLTVECQALSKETFHSLIFQAFEQINKEVVQGVLRMDDGDEVSWLIVSENVEF